MRTLIRRAAVVALTIAVAVLAAPSGVRVETPSGALRGASDHGVESFKGVPFAAAPVGDRRWRPPQPVAAWKGERSAIHYGADCQQTLIPGDSAPLTGLLSEDCLYLNVWRPAGLGKGRKAPVMVWIHGGGFTNGGASSAVYAGDGFARRGVIMVSANYRLGRFGFFGFPALSREAGQDGPLGDYGFMDQIAALRWVQRNIAAFGGDPRNVTVFGESAGGSAIHMLLASPLSRSLFARAIIQSGAGGRDDPAGYRTVQLDRPGLPSLETLGVAFARRHGIEGSDAKALAALRALPAADLDAGLNLATYVQPQHMATYGGPAMDGRLIAISPEQAYRTGRQARVPLIIGSTSADLGIENTSSKDGLFRQFGAAEPAARALYDPDGAGDTDAVIEQASADWTMAEPARFVATQLASQGVPAYEYRFSYVASAAASTWPRGAPHTSDIAYAMDTLRAVYGALITPRDARMARTVNSYWVNFARTGDPNGPGLPRWPAYDPAKDQLMDFAADGRARVVKDPWKARLDLMAAMH